MTSIYEDLDPDAAMAVQRLARLIYETRENRRTVLAAAGASSEDALLDRIAGGEIGEHPAYEQYLAARILRDTHEAARLTIADKLKEVNR